jgi:AcrR family transcriptional regulator
VAAESGVPVSTLQYYFGSREDLLVAAFRHASSAEFAALDAEVADRYDPDKVAVLAVAAADGMGIPLSLGDPEITAGSAVRDVLAALRELLRP